MWNLCKKKITKEKDYKGKRFSILGDSISTLEDYNPEGYSVFYYGRTCQMAGIYGIEDTWWGKVIQDLNGELLVNNSWSGSCVTKLPGQKAVFPSGCCDERTAGLHEHETMPDVIIIYMGTNDWARGVELEIFERSYNEMLKKIRKNYPCAEIWCCTLSKTYISTASDFVFPSCYGGNHIDVYNEIIRKVTSSLHCKIIDLYKYQRPYDSLDGTHPVVAGMNTISTLVLLGIMECTRGNKNSRDNTYRTCCKKDRRK